MARLNTQLREPTKENVRPMLLNYHVHFESKGAKGSHIMCNKEEVVEVVERVMLDPDIRTLVILKAD